MPFLDVLTGPALLEEMLTSKGFAMVALPVAALIVVVVILLIIRSKGK